MESFFQDLISCNLSGSWYGIRKVHSARLSSSRQPTVIHTDGIEPGQPKRLHVDGPCLVKIKGPGSVWQYPAYGRSIPAAFYSI
jgi:hypothetical protein